MSRRTRCLQLLLVALLSTTAHACVAAPEITSFAFVEEDGSLKVAGQPIHLYGIYIPPTEQSCYTFVRPVPCGPRAVLALDFKISGDFVHCTPTAEHADGSITARCLLDDEDLSMWMLQRGWALARPDAPFEYAAQERAAQAKGIGIWGIPIDTFPHPGLRK